MVAFFLFFLFFPALFLILLVFLLFSDFLLEHFFVPFELLESFLGNLRIIRIHFLQGVEDDLADDQPHIPLVIGRNHIPGRFLRSGFIDRRLKRFLIVIPVLALFKVRSRELPVLLRLLDAGKEAACLFLPGDVQEDLYRADTVVPQIFS